MSRPSAPTASPLAPPAGLALRRVLDLTTQILCACDLEGRLVWWNHAFQHLLGWNDNELAGRSLLGLTDDEGADELERAGMPGPSGSKSWEVVGAVARMARRDGSMCLVDWTLRTVSERGLVFAAGRDVTARLASEDAIRAGEARQRAIVAHAPAAIFVKDLGGHYLLVNPAWAKLAGRMPEEMVGATDAHCLSPAVADAIRDLDLALDEEFAKVVDEPSILASGASLASGDSVASVRGEMEVETSDGVRHLLVSLSALCAEDGTRFATCGLATDITERKLVEARVTERQQLLETVLEASPDIISIVDAQGQIRQVSSAEQALLGYRHETPEGTELYALVHPDDFDHVASAFIRMVTGSVSQIHVRFRVLHAEGHWLTVDSRAQAVAGDDGEFAGAVVVTRDVSSRLEAEQRLEELRRAADQASRAKSEFLSRMSHELRTPLNAILGFAQLLEMDDLPIPQSDSVDHISRGGRHLLELIEEVLDIARIESGHLDLAIRAELVSDAVAEVLQRCRPAAERAEVVLQSSVIPENSPAVLADPQRLVQVLVNLVSNAVKYNRPGGRVDISCDLVAEGRVQVVVADTGQGIRPEYLDRVFEPFDRLGAEQSGVDGTGVGLALAKHLVERMHGSISVESVPEVGSTFFVELPMAVMPEDPASPPRSRGSSTSNTFRVLLVEESLDSLELVRRVMARRPRVEVLSATDGRRALELIRDCRPDLVLLDTRLVDMSGSSLLDQLGSDPLASGIPVAVLSDEGDHQVRRLLGRGVAGRLAKPIDVRALLSLVDAARAASGR